jgi:hypothetical protein
MFESKQQNVIQRAFDATGYEDVNFGEVITARRSDGKEWEVVVDRGGQLKVTITSRTGKPTEKSLTISGRKAMVLTEKQTTMTILFRLNDTSELSDVLQAIENALT